MMKESNTSSTSSSSSSSDSNGIKSKSNSLNNNNNNNFNSNHNHNNNCAHRKQPNDATRTTTTTTSTLTPCSSLSSPSNDIKSQSLKTNHRNSNNINSQQELNHITNNHSINHSNHVNSSSNSSMTSIAKSLLSSITPPTTQTPTPTTTTSTKTLKILQKQQQQPNSNIDTNKRSTTKTADAAVDTSDKTCHLENSESPSSISSYCSSTSSSSSSTSSSSNSTSTSTSLSPAAKSSFIVNLLPPLVSGASLLNSIGSILRRSKCYLASLRAGSFTTSLIPVLMGAVLAAKTTGQFSFVILFATVLTVISVHAAGNLVNTYCDYMRGIDSKPRSDDRTLVDSILTPEEVVNLGVLFYVIGCVGLLIVVLTSPARMELLALMYFGGISSSFLYTGGIGLKYIALGDIIIMVTFGPVSVLYSFIAQTGTIRLVTLLYAIPLALNAEAILHSNNTRDIEDDRKAGCVTIAVLIGYSASHVLFALLLFVPYILFTVVSFHSSLWLLLPLITLPKAFQLERQFRDGNLRSLPKQMARLNFYFGIFYLIACVISPPHKLPGLHV